jgi:hypothetical protein
MSACIPNIARNCKSFDRSAHFESRRVAIGTLMIRHRVSVRVKDVYEVRKIDENYFVE